MVVGGKEGEGSGKKEVGRPKTGDRRRETEGRVPEYGRSISEGKNTPAADLNNRTRMTRIQSNADLHGCNSRKKGRAQ